MRYTKQDFYKILGVSRHATPEEIKAAYRKLAKKNHPDINAGDPFFAEKFKELQEAYETLIDGSSRCQYDQQFSPPNNNEDHKFNDTQKENCKSKATTAYDIPTSSPEHKTAKDQSKKGHANFTIMALIIFAIIVFAMFVFIGTRKMTSFTVVDNLSINSKSNNAYKPLAQLEKSSAASLPELNNVNKDTNILGQPLAKIDKKYKDFNDADFTAKRESTSVSIKYDLYGKLKRELFYGPPNYGEDPLHDSKEYSYILELNNTESFLGTSADGTEYQRFNVITITDNNNDFQLAKYIGKYIRVFCTVFEPVSPHYHTKLATETLIEIVPDKSINALVAPNDNFPLNYVYKNYNLLSDKIYDSKFDNISEFKSEEDFLKSNISQNEGIVTPNYEYGIIARIYDDEVPSGDERMAMDIYVTKGTGSRQNEFHPYRKEVFYIFPNSINIKLKQQDDFKKLIKVGRRVEFSSIYEGGNHVGINILSYIKATN